jgi:antitoxin CptB
VPLYDIALMTEHNSMPADPRSEPATLDTSRRRLLFRANHRGTHENDLMVGGFVAARIGTFTDDEVAALEVIMEYPDVDLADWLSGRRPVPAEFDTPMLREMCRAIRP